MPASTSIWSRYVNRLFSRTNGGSRLRRSNLSRREQSPVCAAVQVLEERALLSAVAFTSVVGVGSTGVDTSLDVVTDTTGNVIVTGTFNGTVDFDRANPHDGNTDILTAHGTNDAYVAKYAPNGTLLWVTQVTDDPTFGADATSVARTVMTDASNNIYIGGEFTGIVDFGTLPPLTSSGTAKDGFVAKLGPDGTVLWAKSWGGVGAEFVNAIDVDGSGNVLTAGTTITYNADGSVAYTNAQIEKFNASGALIWAKQIGNTIGGAESANGISTDAVGNVYVSGGFKGTVDFDPGTAKKNVIGGSKDSAFVLKLSAAGNFGWVSPFISQTTDSYSHANDLLVDKNSNNIVVGGYYYGSIDFDPGKGTYKLPTWVFPAGASGVYTGPGFITTLNSAGALLWTQQIGGGTEGGGGIQRLALNAAGDIYATGAFARQSDFDPGAGTSILASNGSTDVFVTKYSARGVYQWAFAAGGTGQDWGRGIAVDTAGNVYIAGYYSSTVDFDPNNSTLDDTLINAGLSDAFLLKLSQV